MSKSRKRRNTNTNTNSQVRTTDAFSNPAANIGAGTTNLMQGTYYPYTNITADYRRLINLYNSSWIVRNVILSIPQDITKNWFRIKGSLTVKEIDKIEKQQRQIELRSQVLDGMTWDRLFGGAAGLIKISGANDLSKPLDYREILPDSFKGLQIFDRWTGIYPQSDKIITDLNSPDFGLPEYYEIRANGILTQVVHHSRIVRFVGRKCPFFEQITENYWGKSELESIYEEIMKRDNVSYNMAGLTFQANLRIYEMDGLDMFSAMASPEMLQQFLQAMQAQATIESNFGARLIDSKSDVKQLQYNFSGLKEIYETIQQDLSGASHIPVTRLFGRSPGGFNSTGDSDLQNYNEYIEQLQESYFRPIIEKLLPIMALSAWGKIPEDLDFIFDPIKKPTDVESAKIVKDKSNAIKDVFLAGIIDRAEAAEELKRIGDSTGVFGSIKDETIKNGEGIFASDLKIAESSGLLEVEAEVFGTGEQTDIENESGEPEQAENSES